MCMKLGVQTSLPLICPKKKKNILNNYVNARLVSIIKGGVTSSATRNIRQLISTIVSTDSLLRSVFKPPGFISA